MKLISRENYPYVFDSEACNDCLGKCCAGESGNTWVASHEIKTIADLLGLNQVDFIQQHLRKLGNRWSLAERFVEGQMFCTFFDIHQRKCSIYTARPDQCRQFPFWEYYRQRVDSLMKECPGVKLTGDKSDQA